MLTVLVSIFSDEEDTEVGPVVIDALAANEVGLEDMVDELLGRPE